MLLLLPLLAVFHVGGIKVGDHRAVFSAVRGDKAWVAATFFGVRAASLAAMAWLFAELEHAPNNYRDKGLSVPAEGCGAAAAGGCYLAEGAMGGTTTAPRRRVRRRLTEAGGGWMISGREGGWRRRRRWQRWGRAGHWRCRG